MPENKKTIVQRLGNIAAIISAVVAIEGAVAWLFMDKINDHIKEIAEQSRPSTRKDLSKEMNVREELVVIELGKMYKEFRTSQENIEEFNDTWIPYLENEKTFFHVGFFVKRVDDELEMWYKDFDGKEYRAWHDQEGWFYQKQGYKIYK